MAPRGAARGLEASLQTPLPARCALRRRKRHRAGRAVLPAPSSVCPSTALGAAGRVRLPIAYRAGRHRPSPRRSCRDRPGRTGVPLFGHAVRTLASSSAFVFHSLTHGKKMWMHWQANQRLALIPAVWKIAKITPYFTQVARVGDSVHMGLQGDMFPKQFEQNRPMATITGIDRRRRGRVMTHSNGATQTVSEYDQPNQGLGVADATFGKILSRDATPRPRRRRRWRPLAASGACRRRSTCARAGRGQPRETSTTCTSRRERAHQDMRNIEVKVPTSFCTPSTRSTRRCARRAACSTTAPCRGANSCRVSDVRNDDDLTDFF